MTHPALPVIEPAELATCAPADPEAGLGALQTSAGNLPLRHLGVHAHIVGLTSRVVLTQRFANPHPEPLEATYVFPLPDRGAVTSLRMIADDRTIVASLREREQARREYDEALAAGHRAAIAEEDRPDVFTLRLGNILPGEQVTVELTVVGVLPVADGAATFRFPLVVAPRYVPGVPLPGDAVGPGWHADTDAVPDASRITPPVLLPGFPLPVTLDVEIEVDPAGLDLGTPRSSLHAVRAENGRIRVEPGARPDRDVVLRIPLGSPTGPSASLTLVPDASGDEATFELTVLPPEPASTARPRDVVLLLDRSGSMGGWKMVAARRAAARIVDTLTEHDNFAVLAFDDRVDTPADLPAGLVAATDRHRFRAVEFLAGLTARGGTELSEPLGRGLQLLAGSDEGRPRRDRVLVLVTDGQVGNEDQLLRTHAAALAGVRLHTVGIDQAVNASFLGRLASFGGGRCELVESEDRLDEAMANIHRRIGSPLVTGVTLTARGITLDQGSVTPQRLPDLFPGVPYVVRGRCTTPAGAADLAGALMTLQGLAPNGEPFTAQAHGQLRAEPAVVAAWARGRLRDLEDSYVSRSEGHFGLEKAGDAEELERRIVALSLAFGVLCRFTAFVAVDDRVVTDGSGPRTVVQPVPLPAGWEMPAPPSAMPMAAMRLSSAPMAMRSRVMPAGIAPRPAATGSGLARTAFAPGAADAAAPQDTELLRSLLATEAQRLREAVHEPEHVRREALADLGSRLTALRGDLRDARWQRLVDLLRPENLAAEPLEETWGSVLSLLDDLAAQGQRGRRGPFWKRSAQR